MKFYFDVTETFTKTVAVEADSINEARKILDKAWDEGAIEINHEAPDDIEFKNPQESIQECIDDGWCFEDEFDTFDNSILTDEEKKKARDIRVHSEKIYSPQDYLELVTGNCYTVDGDNDVEFVEKILEKLDYCLWSFPLNEIDHIIENKLNVVLVDCMILNKRTREYDHIYRWFEVESDEDVDDEEENDEFRNKKVKITSEKLYSPQNYLDLVTGKCYIIEGDNDIRTIERILNEFNLSSSNYALSDIEYILENELRVVLVKCMIYDEKAEKFEHVYRWFEVPKNVDVQYEDKCYV